jgi:hypothetical protein
MYLGESLPLTVTYRITDASKLIPKIDRMQKYGRLPVGCAGW